MAMPPRQVAGRVACQAVVTRLDAGLVVLPLDTGHTISTRPLGSLRQRVVGRDSLQSEQVYTRPDRVGNSGAAGANAQGGRLRLQ